MTEPTSLYAGDTWTWTRDGGAYPADTYTLTYYLRNAKSKIDVNAIADGTMFSVSIPASTTATYRPGRYEWIARVSGPAGSFTVGSGSMEVLPNLGLGVLQDGRSHARKVLDAIEAVIENRATLDQSSYSIGGRSLSRMAVSELISFRDRYKAMVIAEERAARIQSGGVGGKVQVRF